MALACAGLAAAPARVGANNVEGAWSPVTPWPLIAVHAVLMPDGRVLTYGTKTSGQQTAIEIYDVWDPSAGINAGHTTLPNTSGTDLFCSSQLVLPAGGQVFIAGGDNWTGTGTTNTGNNNSNLIDYGNNSISRQSNMNRARWYSSSTTLLNGETYIQGGSGGTDRPGSPRNERRLPAAQRREHRRPRLHVPAQLHRAGRPRLRLRQRRAHVLRDHRRGRLASRWPASSAVPPAPTPAPQCSGPGRILQFGGNSSGALVIDINGAAPSVSTTQSLSSRRRLVNATILADGKVLATGGSDVWNEMTGAAYSADIWNPATGTVDARRQRAARPPVPLERGAHARRERARAGRRRAGTAEQHQRRGLLPAVSLQRRRRPCDPAGHRQRAVDDRRRRDLRGEPRQHGGDRPRRTGQDHVRLAQLQHGATVRRTDFPAVRGPARRAGTDPRHRLPARVLPAVRPELGGHALGRQDRPRAGRAGHQPGRDALDREPRRAVRRGRHTRLAAAFRHGSERRHARRTPRAACRPVCSSMPRPVRSPARRRPPARSTSWFPRPTASTPTARASCGRSPRARRSSSTHRLRPRRP